MTDELSPEAHIAALIKTETLAILSEASYGSGTVRYDPKDLLSEERLLDVANYALRDLDRLDTDQEKAVSISKIVAYISFWFAKIKPILCVFVEQPGETPMTKELRDVNERVAMMLTSRLLLRLVLANPDVQPTTWTTCTCDKCPRISAGTALEIAQTKCFFRKRKAMNAYERKQLFEYAVYGLRYRSVSPYFLVSYVDAAIFYTCEISNAPLFSA